jgi:hypothetical protein
MMSAMESEALPYGEAQSCGCDCVCVAVHTRLGPSCRYECSLSLSRPTCKWISQASRLTVDGHKHASNFDMCGVGAAVHTKWLTHPIRLLAPPK